MTLQLEYDPRNEDLRRTCAANLEALARWIGPHQIRALRALVEAAQWAGTQEYGQVNSCPWCEAWKGEDGGHEADCQAAALMGWERKA